MAEQTTYPVAYAEWGLGLDSWGGDDCDARELNRKAVTLWDATLEAFIYGEAPYLKACYNLNRYGRTLKNMFDCTQNKQPTPTTKERVLVFLEGYAENYDINLHTCKQLVDEGLGKWKYLI